MKNRFNYFIAVLLVSSNLFGGSNQKPKNIILLIADGMGLSQVSVSAISMKNDPFKKFKSIGLMNTCSADNLITDSAAGATAFSTGYKTKNGKIGVDENDKTVLNIVEIAQKKKLATGVIATSSITNATPAAFLSHDATRKNEFGIAEQIVKCNADLLIGGGTDFFLPKDLGGKREDNKNLLDTLKKLGYSVITNLDLLEPSALAAKKVFGINGSTAMPFASKRNYTLGSLTKSAIEKLSKNKKGFFLMVEGSQIDWAADQNNKEYLFSEQRDFNSSILEALKFAEKDKNTLVVVLSDHDTSSLGISGKDKETGELDVVWATKKHTANFVGVFSFGPASNQFIGFLENDEVGKKLINLINKN